MAVERGRGASRFSWLRQLQIIPAQNVFQGASVDLGLFEELLDSGKVFVTAYARGNRDDVFRPEDFCRDTFVLDDASFADGFFSETSSSEELNWETFDEQVLAFDAPAAFLQIGVDRGNSGG